MAQTPDVQRTQEEWLSEAHERARGGGLPGWAKFCGCGCLLVVLLAVALVFIGVRDWKRALDQDVQREQLAEVVPYDGTLPDFKLFGLPWFLDLWTANDRRGYMWVFVETDGGREERRAQIFSTDPAVEDPIFGFQDVENVELRDFEVQGRTLQLKSFHQEGSELLESISLDSSRSDGACVCLDVAPEGGSRMVLVVIIAVDADDPISDDELRALLAPFHIGPAREPWVDPPPAAEEDEGPPAEEDR